MKKLSVVLPCFNESKNIPYVLERFDKVINRDDIEVIFIDNGSTDDTYKVLKNLTPKYNFAKVEKIKFNRGYGNGIKRGLQVAKGSFLSWTHADMQTDPNDIIRGLNIIESFPNSDKIFIKGLREGRNLVDNFFTIGMSIFESLLLISPLWDINAQPTIFHRELFDSVIESPDDFSLDLFYYYVALKKKYKILRLKVFFGDRYYGSSKWNINWKSRIIFIIRTISFSFNLIKKLNINKKLLFKKN